ncbi:hypothetical protein [Novosphingobium sp.]|uniref:hypothetical protein n=1 Tax=Novosphingobium sp. TaxID=1874826 RepID=UPI003341CD22
MSKTDDKPEAGGNGSWAAKAALAGAGAAIGSAAIAAALLYASQRKDRADKAKAAVTPTLPPETD